MSISLGEVTVSADKQIKVHTISLSDQSGVWTLYIEYFVKVGASQENKRIVLSGEEYNNFYTAWLSGKQIMDKVLEAEGVSGVVIDEPTAEAEFLNVEVEESGEEEQPVE